MPNESELLQKIIDSSNATIYLKDEDGRFIMVNHQAANRVNLSPEDFAGKTLYDYLPKEECDIIRSKELKVMEAGVPKSFKFHITTPGGKANHCKPNISRIDRRTPKCGRWNIFRYY